MSHYAWWGRWIRRRIRSCRMSHFTGWGSSPFYLITGMTHCRMTTGWPSATQVDIWHLFCQQLNVEPNDPDKVTGLLHAWSWNALPTGPIPQFSNFWVCRSLSMSSSLTMIINWKSQIHPNQINFQWKIRFQHRFLPQGGSTTPSFALALSPVFVRIAFEIIMF